MTPRLKTLQDAENYLLQYSPLKKRGQRYTLGRMQELMRRLDSPQDKLRVLHIAGTSGKTSTAYFIRALLEQTGKKTGLTASPHVVSITERVQVGGHPLSDEDFLRYLNEFLTILQQWPDLEPTYFELLMAFAYWVFWKEKVDYAVIETGLGGSLDASNVVTREDKVCVLTSIGLDHTDVLGETVVKVAHHKAGIIKPRNRVLSAQQTPEVREEFEEASRSQSAPLTFVGAEDKDAPLYLPAYQYQNWYLACAVVKYIQQRDDLSPLTPQQKAVAVRSTPPGRFEQYKIGPTTVILDGAHNPQKLEALIHSLPQSAKDAWWLLAMSEAPSDKLEDSLKVLSKVAKNSIWTDFQVGQDIKGRRSFASKEVAQKARRYGIHSDAVTDPLVALQQCLAAAPDSLIITGSLFLVALLRPELERLATRPSYQPPAK